MADSRLRLWVAAVALAGWLALIRIIVDWLVPPHLQWWLTASVAFGASLLTSWYWIAWRRRG